MVDPPAATAFDSTARMAVHSRRRGPGSSRRPRRGDGCRIPKKHFIGIDVADAGDEGLVQEDAFQPPPARLSVGYEIHRIRFPKAPARERTVPEQAPSSAVGRQRTTAEFTDIMKSKLAPAILEPDDEVGVLVEGRGPGRPIRIRRSSQMEYQDAVAGLDDEVASPAGGRR